MAKIPLTPIIEEILNTKEIESREEVEALIQDKKKLQKAVDAVNCFIRKNRSK